MATKASNTRPVINQFGIQTDTDRTLYVTWLWERSYTDHYEVRWYYDTGDGVWFIDNPSATAEFKQSTYTPPDNAIRVRFRVRAISKTYQKNGKTTNRWTCQWSTFKYHTMDVILPVPEVPNIEIKNNKLTTTIENVNPDKETDQIEFYITKDNISKYDSEVVNIITNRASFTQPVAPGAEYKVRARFVRGSVDGEWSNYSNNEKSGPVAPDEITELKGISKTEVRVDWTEVKTAESYQVEYTTEKRYFDSGDQTTVKTVTSDNIDLSVPNFTYITGLEIGHEYFFRVRACIGDQKSGWTEIKSITIGKKPAAPTTWSSTSTVIVGDTVNLYWVHNSVDGSSQTTATVKMEINGQIITKEIQNSTNEDEKDKTSVYKLDTSLPIDDNGTITLSDGDVIKWSVCTKGVTDEYSDWSTIRTLEFFSQPTLHLEVNDVNGLSIESLTSFPFYIHGITNPNTQKPIGYHVKIISNESYEDIDQLGNITIISEGDVIYSKYFDTVEDLVIELSAGNVNLENNIEYTVYCIASMNSGLTAESTYTFTVAWSEEMYEPNAGISYDPKTYSVSINPYCNDENEVFIEDILLSVYRINYDGSFTEIETNIDNNYTFVTDPHPALNYARYRIVATSKTTGAVSYFDMPGYYIGESAVIIQWAETWKHFNVEGDEEIDEKAWSGSLLRLPYNINTSDNNSPDVALIEYIGRENPVSYYGTQLGVSSTWTVEIDKNDDETIYALRRLSRWMGDVYVREPSGTGYWANVTVSFSKNHDQLTIPITLNVTKVEGGV